ncbi:MAG: pilus assembly protein [Deltaproteobacteria bacterium]|nr:pilus assembly protein [Deltaproteobacteria bacterium]
MRARPSRRGVAAVEFGLWLPVISVILLAIVEYGWLLYRRSEVTRAVREGVRYAVVMPQTSVPDPITLAETRCETVLTDLNFDLSAATIAGSYSDITGDAAGTPDTLTLDVQVPYAEVTGGLVPTPPFIAVSMSMMLQDSE